MTKGWFLIITMRFLVGGGLVVIVRSNVMKFLGFSYVWDLWCRGKTELTRGVLVYGIGD